MSDHDGLICAYALDGAGGGRALGWDGIAAADRQTWVHLDRAGTMTRRWLAEQGGLAPVVCEAMLAEETRPRVELFGDGMMVNLRGVNLNPGADPEDMVSLRLWVEPKRVVSVRLRRLMAVEDLRAALDAGRGPRDAPGLHVALAGRLVDRMQPVIDALDEAVADLETDVLAAQRFEQRTQLAQVRREAIALRRYIGPQREAMARLVNDAPEWFGRADRIRMREIADRITRYVEDLDEARDRAAVVQDELANRLAERMSRTMYALSIVATVFLPLGFLTGLLGVNVGGIPGAETDWAFLAVAIGMVVLVALELAIFRLFRWL